MCPVPPSRRFDRPGAHQITVLQIPREHSGPIVTQSDKQHYLWRFYNALRKGVRVIAVIPSASVSVCYSLLLLCAGVLRSRYEKPGGNAQTESNLTVCRFHLEYAGDIAPTQNAHTYAGYKSDLFYKAEKVRFVA